jgi:hypothetical protein
MNGVIHGSPERRERHESHLDHFTRRLEGLALRAETLGVSFGAVVTTPDLVPVFQHTPDTEFFAASTGKVTLALLARKYITTEIKDYLHDQKRDSIDVAELMEDMLKRSSNDAFREIAIVFGGPDEINRYLSPNWRHTHVNTDPKTGRTEIGNTTPSEILMQFRELIARKDEVDDPFYDVIINSLRQNEVERYGIRQVMSAQTAKASSLDKSGEYNGDDKTPAVRNVVGLLMGKDGRQSYLYSCMTSARPGKASGWLENQIVAQFGAEMLDATGHQHTVGLGLRALRAANILKQL